MLGCLLELALAGYGLYLLFNGETKLPTGRTARGPMVRLAGAIFLLPFPIAFMIGFVIGFSQGVNGRAFDPRQYGAMLTVIEFGLLFGSMIFGAIVLMMAGQGETEPERRVRKMNEMRIYDAVLDFEQPLDVVAVVPCGPAITAERPLRRQRPDMDPSKGYGALRPEAEPPTPVAEREPPMVREVIPAGLEPRDPSPSKENLLTYAACAMIFLIVAGVGAVIMWPK